MGEDGRGKVRQLTRSLSAGTAVGQGQVDSAAGQDAVSEDGCGRGRPTGASVGGPKRGEWVRPWTGAVVGEDGWIR